MADNVWQRFASGLRGIFNRGEDPRRVYRYYPLPMQAAGITLSYENATQLSVVWACMDAITKAIASSQWRVFERRGRQRLQLPDDPLHYLLNTRPNPEMTAIAFRECMLYQALSWGNAYAEIVRDGAGRVAQLWPMMSDRVAMRRQYNTDGQPVGDIYYEYYQFEPSGAQTVLRQDQVYHLRGPSPSGWLGDNIVARAAKAIALGVAMERWSSSFYANGAYAGVVLTNDRPLDDKAYDRMKARWNDDHLGPDKAMRVAVLDGGWKVDTLSAEPDKLELIGTRKFQLEEICRFFGVPPHRVQDLSRATYNNIEHLGLEFCRDALTPWCERLEQEASFKLLPQRAPWRSTDIDIAWLSHGDASARSGFYEKMRNMGVFSANDILEKEDMNTIGAEGDKRVIMSNYTFFEGIQALIDKTNAEAEALRAGQPDPTPTLEDPATDGGLGGGVQSRLLESGVQASATPAETPAAPAIASGPRAEEALRGAVEALAAGALERYGKRLQNRRADLETNSKKSAPQRALALAEERDKTRPRLVEELREALAFLPKQCVKETPMGAFLLAADDVDNGLDPLAAATVLVRRALADGELSVQGHTQGVQGG